MRSQSEHGKLSIIANVCYDDNLPCDDDGMFKLDAAVQIAIGIVNGMRQIEKSKSSDLTAKRFQILKKEVIDYICKIKKFEKRNKQKQFSDWLHVMTENYRESENKNQWTEEIKTLALVILTIFSIIESNEKK